MKPAKTPYTINVHQSLLSDIGTFKEEFLPLTEEEDSDFQVNKDEELLVQITKIDEKGLSIFIPEQEIAGKVRDAVSLEEFEYIISTFPIERRYYTSIPEEEEPDMTEKIHTGSYDIDLESLVNEAIYLNIPYSFHKDENTKPKSFTTDNAKSNSPFAKLKDMKNT